MEIFGNHPQPRWFRLYLVLPLAGVLVWVIRRVEPAGTARSVLDLGALAVTFGYVEAWRLANSVALLHHPLVGNSSQPIYYVREVTGSPRRAAASPIQAVFVADGYADLFGAPVIVGEAPPAVLELAAAAGTAEEIP